MRGFLFAPLTTSPSRDPHFSLRKPAYEVSQGSRFVPAFRHPILKGYGYTGFQRFQAVSCVEKDHPGGPAIALGASALAGSGPNRDSGRTRAKHHLFRAKLPDGFSLCAGPHHSLCNPDLGHRSPDLLQGPGFLRLGMPLWELRRIIRRIEHRGLERHESQSGCLDETINLS